MKSDTTPYIINWLDRDNLDTGTVDITKFLTKEGLMRYLDDVSYAFHALHVIKSEKEQMYFIAQENYEAIKVGVTKNLKDRLATLQVGNPYRLRILFHYDPVVFHKQELLFFQEDEMTIYQHEKRNISWLCINKEFKLYGEWFKPDERAFRILIKLGLNILERGNEREDCL